MSIGRQTFSFTKAIRSVDWKLLLFLVLFMNVKLLVKCVALLLIFILQPDLRFGLKFKKSRLPLFYLSMIGIAVLDFFIYRDFSANYSFVFLAAVAGWGMCFLSVHQLKLFTERTEISTLKNTLLVFFMLNVLFSFADIAAIFAEIGIRNPYRYQGQYQKYFINTGDHIRGLLFDVSTTNALINCFGVVYFLHQKKYWTVMACMTALILTASNTANLFLAAVLFLLFLLRSSREQKSVMAACIMMIVVFLSAISPQNNTYLDAVVDKFVLKESDRHPPKPKLLPIRQRPDSELTDEGLKEKRAVLFLDSVERMNLFASGVTKIPDEIPDPNARPEIPKDSIHTATFQWRRDTTAFQRQLLDYISSGATGPEPQYDEKDVGKILALQQSVSFLKANPNYLISGTGPGKFASKLAFKATGLNIAGGFPARFVYCNSDFLNNHLRLYIHFLLQNAGSHSIIHNPASVYDQLVTEYGMIGLCAFIFLYLIFFLKRISIKGYGLPMLLLLLMAFTIDYWFEQLSVVVLFELLIFIDIKENNLKTNV